MLDTIVVTLSKGCYYIKEPNMFEPSANLILDSSLLGRRGYIKCQQNPTKTELKQGIYKPRLTLTNRFNHTGRYEATLKIELSLPKLLYRNNFDELIEGDAQKAVKLLKLRLKEMGVMVFEDFLLKAPISAIHYSKNIPLTDGTTPHYLISRIREANTSLSLDVNQTDYRNDGYSYKWHANSYEIAFYDKIKDVEIAQHSEKRAIEKDNSLQLGLFESFSKRILFDVLRFEVRLNKRQKISQLFRCLRIDKELTYQNLVDVHVSMKVLSYYLQEIESKRLKLFDYKPHSPKDLLSTLKIENPGISVRKLLQVFGLKRAFDTMNPRELRMVMGNLNQRGWYRLMNDAKGIKVPRSFSPLNIIGHHLAIYKPFRLLDFRDKMLNNDKY